MTAWSVINGLYGDERQRLAGNTFGPVYLRFVEGKPGREADDLEKLYDADDLVRVLRGLGCEEFCRTVIARRLLEAVAKMTGAWSMLENERDAAREAGLWLQDGGAEV